MFLKFRVFLFYLRLFIDFCFRLLYRLFSNCIFCFCGRLSFFFLPIAGEIKKDNIRNAVKIFFIFFLSLVLKEEEKCTEGGTRTHTNQGPTDFESVVSTNFTTSALKSSLSEFYNLKR